MKPFHLVVAITDSNTDNKSLDLKVNDMWTNNQVKAFKLKKTRYRLSEDTKQRGSGRLVIDIQPTGMKTFFFQYFRDSKRVLVSLGRFKQGNASSGVTLSEARNQANVYGKLLQQGIDVENYIEELRREEIEKRKKLDLLKLQGTFDQLLDSYLEDMEHRGKSSHQSVRRSLKTYVKEPFQDLVKRPAGDIEADDIRKILARMIDKGVTTHTNRVRSYLHAAFQHGLKQDNDPRSFLKESVKFNLKYNPVSFVPKMTEYERVGEHVISEQEISLIWNNFTQSRIAELVVKLAFTTGQRLGELVRLRVENCSLEDKALVIPAHVSKNRRDHLVPLSNLSMDILDLALKHSKGCEFIFPASRGGKLRSNGHTSSTTIAKIIRDYCSNQEDGETKVSDFVSRDIRRTVKTLMGKAGIEKSLRDRIQNHVITDVSSKHYDRYDYLKEKQYGMKVWNDYLDLIINPRKNVRQMRNTA